MYETKNAREVGSISATRPPAGTPRRASSAAQRCPAAYNSPNVIVRARSSPSVSSVISRCARSASWAARYRMTSMRVSAEKTPASAAARCSFCVVTEARNAEATSASSALVRGDERIMRSKSSGVFASEAARSGKRTSNAVSSRASNSTRSRLPSPRSRSSCEAALSMGSAPWLPSSFSRPRITSSTRSRTAERSS